jgi:hypothetical protein
MEHASEHALSLVDVLNAERLNMSASRIDRAHDYRERAEALRTVADVTFLEESRVILTRLANSYETMAATLEAIEAARKSRISEEAH